MRGNKLARGGDPFRSKGQRKRDRKAKIARSPRAQRLKKVLTRVKTHKNQLQQKDHVTALMESLALRRQKKRAEEKKLKQQEEAEREAEQEEEKLQLEKKHHNKLVEKKNKQLAVGNTSTDSQKKGNSNNNKKAGKKQAEPKPLSKLQRQLQAQRNH